MLQFENFTQVGGAQGSNRGGVYEHADGSRWYLKQPNSDRQGHNEVMASAFYTEMGFDAIEYQWVDNGMVASEWREGLPNGSNCPDLRSSSVMQEAFLPSAWIANWDVVGLVYDNALYDPDTMAEPVFLDFGGSFDTRAMGGHKDFHAGRVMALDGFTDDSINASATCVFRGMTPSLWSRSKERIRSVRDSVIGTMVESTGISAPERRVRRLRQRRELLMDTEYDDVF